MKWNFTEDRTFSKLRRRIEVPFHSVRTDRKSTRLNSSHLGISYAVFCLKKKKYVTSAMSASGFVTRASTLPAIARPLILKFTGPDSVFIRYKMHFHPVPSATD